MSPARSGLERAIEGLEGALRELRALDSTATRERLRRNLSEAPVQKRSSKSECKYCGNEIGWLQEDDGRWTPMDPNDARHDCRNKVGGTRPQYERAGDESAEADIKDDLPF